MYPFDHPAWDVAKDAFGNTPIRDELRALSRAWDEDAADDLFFSALLHQGTVYSATFLAVPHVIALANGGKGEALSAIAAFLGGVALHAYDVPANGGETLHLASAWYRSEPFIGVDATFRECLPQIADICHRAYLLEPSHYHASGVAAGMGYRALGAFLFVENDRFDCPSCRAANDWAMIGDTLAIYAERGPLILSNDAAMLDWQDGAPNRAASTGIRCEPEHPEAAALRHRLGGGLDRQTDLQLRNFRCEVGCAACDWRGELPS